MSASGCITCEAATAVLAPEAQQRVLTGTVESLVQAVQWLLGM